jgi:hypothetical protein
MKQAKNEVVAEYWARGIPAKNWGTPDCPEGTLYTDGKKIYSYNLQIGDTTDDGKKIVKDYTAQGTYGFRSQTTSCHVGRLRYIRGYETFVF